MPYPGGERKETETVQIWGVEPDSLIRVTEYAEAVHWRSLFAWQKHRLLDDALSANAEAIFPDITDAQWDVLAQAEPGMEMEAWQSVLTDAQWEILVNHDPRLASDGQVLEDGLTLSRNGNPGIALGMHVSVGNERQSDGSYMPLREGYWWMPAFNVTLTTIPISGEGGILEPESFIFPVVNEFVSGVFVVDESRVMIPIDIAQRLTGLDSGFIIDPDDPEDIKGEDPARATMILIRTQDGYTPEQVRDAVANAYDEFSLEIMNDPEAIVKLPSGLTGLKVQTWEQQQAAFIGPIEKERELMRTLFSLIYLVCAGLVLAIFWAIVYEKTRDIGILRSIGASRLGISWIFLRYGLVVGVLGAIFGLGLGWLVVHNINVIHDAIGDPPLWLGGVVAALALVCAFVTVYQSLSGKLLPLVLGSIVTLTLAGLAAGILVLHNIGGFVLWDPSVYYFVEIPNSVDMGSAYLTMIGAVLFSVLGAFFPAAKAADVDPVKALRYE